MVEQVLSRAEDMEGGVDQREGSEEEEGERKEVVSEEEYKR